MKTRKNTIKRLGIFAAVLAMCLTVLTACGGPANLEEALNDEDVQSTLKTVEKSGVKVTAKDNTMIYTYTFDDSYDFSSSDAKKQAAKELKAEDASLEESLESSVDTIEEETGLEDISVKVIYKDSKGDTIYEKTFDF
ncbi:MAG: DUF4854 domain-containing protein [Eubacteriaceae bacterium]|nr:DUF4854 domain-containing protein [Eubacteriaceae bacterium]